MENKLQRTGCNAADDCNKGQATVNAATAKIQANEHCLRE